MSFAHILWAIAAALMLCASAGLAFVALRRLMARAVEARLATARARLMADLLSGDTDPGALRRLVAFAGRQGVLAPIIMHVLAMVRGRSRDVFIHRLTAAGASELLADQLRRARPAERRRSAEALAAFSDPRSQAMLRNAWRDPAANVRAAALLASIERGDPPSFDFVFERVLRAQSSERASSTGVLRRLCAAKPDEAADWLARVPLAPHIAVAMLSGIARAANAPASVSAIAELARHHSDAPVRAAAITALAGHTTAIETSRQVIIAALGDRDWQVRVCAINAARRLRLRSAIAELDALCSDANWWVRTRAGEATTALSGRLAS